MIAAARIEDQELPIAAKSSGVNNPTVAGRGNFAARARGDGKTFLRSADAVRPAELANASAIDRQAQVPAHVGKGNRRRETAGITQCGEFRMGRVLGDVAISLARRPLGAVEPRLQLGNKVLDRVDLAREVVGALAFAVESLFGIRLLLLSLVDKQTHAQLLPAKQIEVAGEAIALGNDFFAHVQKRR